MANIIQGPMNPIPLYLYKSNHQMHFLTCKANTDCNCSKNILASMACEKPFVIVVISENGSHLSSCNPDFCQCNLYGFEQFRKDDKNIIHLKNCQHDECHCELKVQQAYVGPSSMPPRGKLIEKNGILHILNSCNGLPCKCTQKLFKCAYYRHRLSRHGLHLTRCHLSIDEWETNTVCNCNLLFSLIDERKNISEDNLTNAFKLLFNE